MKRTRHARTAVVQTGVRLSDGKNHVDIGKHVHLSNETWSITSNVSPSDILSHDVLDRVLPGALGAFVYPNDAVFHIMDKPNTTNAHFNIVLTAEKDCQMEEVAMHLNQRTVVAERTLCDPEEDVESEDSELEDEYDDNDA